MTVLPSGGLSTDMRLQRINKPERKIFFTAAVIITIGILAAAALFYKGLLPARKLIIRNAVTGEVYKTAAVRKGDQLSFEWQHSFEHIPWNEYYEVTPEGSFLLKSMSVAGFGAGIPAEMDVSYRYEDGMIYMDDINSLFPSFHWINSATAMRRIELNGEILVQGTDLPHHEKMELYIR